MATNSSHRLIMGKEEIDNFFLSHWIYFDFFTDRFIEPSSTFHMTSVQIGEFNWLSGGKKGQFS